MLLTLSTLQDAVHVAERIQQVFASVSLPQAAQLETSIGIALSSPEEGRPEVLLRNADTALRRAKALGRGGNAVFDAATHTDQRERLRVEHDLEGALARGELRVYYRPIVALETQIVGVEALLRWQQPEQGLVLPDTFIPVAEQTGLIVPLESWVIEQAFTQLKKWREAGHTELFVSVNVSARQLVGTIRETLERLGLSPASVALELTESIFVEETDEIVTRFKTLYDLDLGL